MNYLCTGSAGFIGSHLVDKLLEGDNKVTVIDHFSVGKFKNLSKSIDNQNLRVIDDSILGDISELFKGVDVVFHLAALTRPQWSILHPYESTETNVLGTIRILEHCRDFKVKRIVFASTSNIYGDQDIYPTPEDVQPHPMNSYALSKWFGEEYCRLFQKLHGLEWNAIRPFNAYGTRMPLSGYYTSAVATFINCIKNNLPLETYGTGEQRRDFIYVDDIVDQMILMAHSEVFGEAFNCGMGINYSINEILGIVKEIMKSNIEPLRHPAQFEPKGTLADISKAERLLGWIPKVNITEGLRRTING